MACKPASDHFLQLVAHPELSRQPCQFTKMVLNFVKSQTRLAVRKSAIARAERRLALREEALRKGVPAAPLIFFKAH
jgi:hypothetical protein